jgi:hypothetical protein
MKSVLAFLFSLGRNGLRPTRHASHDDSLRANQGDPGPTFSFWRALVS